MNDDPQNALPTDYKVCTKSLPKLAYTWTENTYKNSLFEAYFGNVFFCGQLGNPRVRFWADVRKVFGQPQTSQSS